MIGQEAKRVFVVHVLNKSGSLVKVSQLACTKWHAIELVYTKLMSAQPDRTKYTCPPKRGLS